METQKADRSSAHAPTILVYGAAGHTGRFVVEQVQRRGWTAVLSGRDELQLRALSERLGGAPVRVASIEDARSLDRAVAGVSAVINCAGPFLDTSAGVIEACLRACVHYLDVAAEQPTALAVFETYGARARNAGVVLMPAVAFYGGLSDLLATLAMGDWPEADAIEIANMLDSWRPTLGTRRTGARNTARRLTFADGRLEPLADPAPTGVWRFPEPVGVQDVVAVHLTEIVTISRHLKTSNVRAWMNLAPLADLADSDTPSPVPADDSGRSAQTFLVEAVVRRGDQTRRASARGRDIYAVTAPLVVEAASRILAGEGPGPGARTAGESFDAQAFLSALAPEFLIYETGSAEVPCRSTHSPL